ncbi:MAG: hypothetical protein K8R92_05170 [Planctomycetes bacterium]|nr:hypothetical protein [Planctomycetota bacterium]
MRSLVRILSLSLALALVAGGGWLAISIMRTVQLQREVARLEVEIEHQKALRQEMSERLGKTRRIGRVEIRSQQLANDPAKTPLSAKAAAALDPNTLTTTLNWIEMDEHGREVGRRSYTIPGTTLFVDAWTVRFPQESVVADDFLRGRSLVLLRRIYSDAMKPKDGFPIDTPGSVPDGYAAGEPQRFEQSVWKGFWRLASNPEAAAREGIRVAQGEAVYKPVSAGQVYELQIENAGGLTLTPLGGGEIAQSPRRN